MISNSKIITRFVKHNLIDCYNSIVETYQFTIIKYASWKSDHDINKCRRSIIANMLRSSGFGFISTNKLTENLTHSDHEDFDALLVPGLDKKLATKISCVMQNVDFLYYNPHFLEQIEHVNLVDDATKIIPKNLVAVKNIKRTRKKIETELLYEKHKDKYFYNFSRQNPKLLINLLDSYSYKFQNPTENNASQVYHEIQEEENICYFGFSEVIKFMPCDTIIKNDDFKDSNIVSRLEVYLPLVKI
jgi:hypothetical protein